MPKNAFAAGDCGEAPGIPLGELSALRDLLARYFLEEVSGKRKKGDVKKGDGFVRLGGRLFSGAEGVWTPLARRSTKNNVNVTEKYHEIRAVNSEDKATV